MNLLTSRFIRSTSSFSHYSSSLFNPLKQNKSLSTLWNAGSKQSAVLQRKPLPLYSNMSFATLVDSEAYLKRKREVFDAVNSEIITQPENKLFAVVHVGGRQHKVTMNDLIVVNSMQAELGSQILLKKVLLVGSENFTLIGRPLLSENEVSVTATVVEHTKLKKVVVFKKKRRKNYKRTKGHRQPVSVLRISNLEVSPNIN